MTAPRVSVVILHLNDVEGLLDCLDSLRSVQYPAMDVVLVHNGAYDPELERKISSRGGVAGEIHNTGGNIGFAAGSNAGMRIAFSRGADYVLLLNDDTVVAPDFLALLVAEAERDRSAGMLGPQVLYFSDPRKVSFAGAEFDQPSCMFRFPFADGPALTSPAPIESSYIAGCAMLVRRELADKIGLLDEKFFLYWEDSDWGLRAKNAGYRCVVVPSAKIWHKVSASSGGGDSPAKAYYKTRGQLLFAERHAVSARMPLLAGFARDIAWLLIRSRRPGRLRKALACIKAIFDYYTGKTGQGW